MSVGSRIREIRKAQGKTLQDVALETDLDTGNLSRLERDEQGWTKASLDAIARALGVKVAEFFAEEPTAEYAVNNSRRVPVVGTAQMGDQGYWLELEYPTGHGSGYVTFPVADGNAYALRVRGDSMRPRFKPNEFVIVAPNARSTPGDEVVVRTKDGRVMVKVLGSRRHGALELLSVNNDFKPITLDEADVDFVHRIAGAAQPDLFQPE